MSNGLRHANFFGCVAMSLRGSIGLLLLLVSGALGATEAPLGSSTLIFQSRAPGESGGGIAVSVNPNGHTFRVLQRTHVDAIGARLSGTLGETVYGAIHRVATPDTAPDAVNESRLVGTTLLHLPGAVDTVTAPIDVELEPGWYSVVIGTGRHGASAGTFIASAINTGTARTERSVGPYTVNATTNARTLQGATTRYVVFGEELSPLPPPDSRYLFETAGPATWWLSQSFTLGGNQIMGSRFSLSEPIRIERVAAWLGQGSGTLFAAIFPLSGPSGNPPSPGSASFESSAVASAVFAAKPTSDEVEVDFGGLTLPPGHYALVFGSGRFGASGSAGMMVVDEQIIVPGSLLTGGSSWFNTEFNIRVVIEGVMPELEVTPEPVNFGGTGMGETAQATVTVRNLRDSALQITAIDVEGDTDEQFALAADAAVCTGAVLEAMGQCSFGVSFTPSVLGPSEAVLRVLSDGIPSPYDVLLSGSGLPSFSVTPSAGSGGSIDPDQPVTVVEGQSATFILMPDPFYSIASIDGDCDGNLVGNQFITAPVIADCSVVASFVADLPASITIVAGDGQATTVTTGFPDALEVRVLNVEGVPLEDIEVAFSAVTSGTEPGASVPAVAMTDDDGMASVSAQANQVAGDHVVTATVEGLAQTAVFELINLPGPPAEIAVFAGDGQSAVVGTLFGESLGARVRDSFGNPVPDVMVEFEAPATGASALLSDEAVATAPDGVASVSATANSEIGSYAIVALVSGLEDATAFALSNTEQLIELVVSIDNGQAIASYGDVLDYLVTVSNSGSVDATRVSVATLLPDALDAGSAVWVCLDTASGCSDSGSGALVDADVTVPVGGSVRWLLSVAVRTDVVDDVVVAEAVTASPDQAAMPVDEDSTRLRLFADGFEAAEAP